MARRTCSRAWPPARTSTPPSTRSARRSASRPPPRNWRGSTTASSSPSARASPAASRQRLPRRVAAARRACPTGPMRGPGNCRVRRALRAPLPVAGLALGLDRLAVRVLRRQPGGAAGSTCSPAARASAVAVSRSAEHRRAVVVGARHQRPAPQRGRVDDRMGPQSGGQRVGMPLGRHQHRCAELARTVMERAAGDAAVVDVQDLAPTSSANSVAYWFQASHEVRSASTSTCNADASTVSWPPARASPPRVVRPTAAGGRGARPAPRPRRSPRRARRRARARSGCGWASPTRRCARPSATRRSAGRAAS